MMNSSQVRVADPILTTHAQGYRNAALVGSVLFPRVPVAISGGKVIEFGKEAFMQYNARRAPGGPTKRINLGYLGKDFALVQDALEGQVPWEHMRDASVQPGINLAKVAVNSVMRILELALEIEQAEKALTAANYDNDHKVALAGSDKWSHVDGTPTADIASAKSAVRSSIGIDPNTVLLSAQAFEAASTNPSVLERFKFTSSDPVTPAMLAKIWEVDQVVVGKAVKASDAGAMSDVWGNNAVVAYVAKPTGGSGGEISLDMAEPSFGYTYAMNGHPLVEEPYNERNAKSWIYPVTYERAPVLSGIVAGFLIQNPK